MDVEHPSSTAIHDVAIVGAGPVGLLLALGLSRAGHDVVVIERQAQPFDLPRAVHFDDEIARVLAAAGLGPDLGSLTEPADTYEWRNAAGQTLLHFDWSGIGPSGWPIANMFHQPTLEGVLARHVANESGVVVHRGEQVIDIVDGPDDALITSQGSDGGHEIRARYVVGCDGARSFVRECIGGAVTDLGFAYDWLVVDLISESVVDGPMNLQVCDPVRPTTAVSGGPGRRRFEFLRLPHESITDLENPATVWRLLEPWGFGPDNTTLERHVVYGFRAAWAETWRAGRLLIAGDAAHQMPPFAGQGMCSGMRDVANLTWKLDLVLRGIAHDDLLDTYASERSAHVQNAIGQSVALGNVICVTDPAAVAERDAVMLAGGGDPRKVLPPIAPPTLGVGVGHRRPDGSMDPAAGRLAAQPRVTDRDGVTGLWDEVVGVGFAVISPHQLTGVLGEQRLAELQRFGVRVTRLVPAGAAVPPGAVADADSTVLPHLVDVGHDVVVVRPDGYLFGAVVLADAGRLIDDLVRQLAGLRLPELVR